MSNSVEIKLSFIEEKVVESDCNGCFFYDNGIDCSIIDELDCHANDRVDNSHIIYKLHEQ